MIKKLRSLKIYSIFSLIFIILFSALMIVTWIFMYRRFYFYDQYFDYYYYYYKDVINLWAGILFMISLGIIASFTLTNFILAIVIMTNNYNKNCNPFEAKKIKNSALLWGLLSIFLINPIGLIVFSSITIKKFKNKENYQDLNMQTNSSIHNKAKENKIIETLKKEMKIASNKTDFELAGKLKSIISDLETNI